MIEPAMTSPTPDTDKNGRLHDENGQYVNISTLFERERQEHMKDHEQERTVARDTAQRLEREVERTAQRLERVVEETAMRLQTAVNTALAAVTETARVHAEAHNKEHIAHERIHQVEKTQVDKAEISMSKRLDGMNEFRDALQDQANRAVSREVFDQRTEAVNSRIGALEKNIVGREAFHRENELRDTQIDLLNEFRSRALGVGVALALISGAIGAAIVKVLGG